MSTSYPGRPDSYHEYGECCEECESSKYSDGRMFCIRECDKEPEGLGHNYGIPTGDLLRWMHENEVQPTGICPKFKDG